MIYIHDLKLTNFRCYKEKELSFSPNLNILVGANAVGKTSIAEAIHCLGFLKSHKATSDNQMIMQDEDFALIKASIIKEEKTDDVLLSFTSKGKRIQVNHKAYQKLSEYLGYLYIVFFCPEDLEIVKGAPSVRRKFLDTNLCAISDTYLKSLIIYRKLLKQRNEVLKDLSLNKRYDQTLLDIITKAMIPEINTIIKERENFINLLNPLIKEKAQFISGGRENVSLLYQPSLKSDLIKNTKIDLMAKTTTAGPHRDDFVFEINEAKASVYASQGQQRTSALALKLALADFLRNKTEDIIIILDDVFSELDLNRQNEILKLLNSEYQIFITTTTINNLSPEILKDSQILRLKREDMRK